MYHVPPMYHDGISWSFPRLGTSGRSWASQQMTFKVMRYVIAGNLIGLFAGCDTRDSDSE